MFEEGGKKGAHTTVEEDGRGSRRDVDVFSEGHSVLPELDGVLLLLSGGTTVDEGREGVVLGPLVVERTPGRRGRRGVEVEVGEEFARVDLRKVARRDEGRDDVDEGVEVRLGSVGGGRVVNEAEADFS